MSTATEIVEELKFPTEVQLLTFYVEDVMEAESTDNIYKFCIKHSVQETDFYAHFSSMLQLKQQTWITHTFTRFKSGDYNQKSYAL